MVNTARPSVDVLKETLLPELRAYAKSVGFSGVDKLWGEVSACSDFTKKTPGTWISAIKEAIARASKDNFAEQIGLAHIQKVLEDVIHAPAVEANVSNAAMHRTVAAIETNARRAAATSTESWRTSVEDFAKSSPELFGLGALMAAGAFCATVPQVVGRDETGKRHISWNRVTVSCLQACIAAACGYLAYAGSRGARPSH